MFQLLILLLRVSVRFADRLGRLLSASPRRRKLSASDRGTFAPGISVLILERGNSAILENCLTSVQTALAQLNEPSEVIVVVDGASAADYVHLIGKHSARWLFFKRPLWTEGAVRKGLKIAKHDWVYLLNGDMVFEPPAIAQLLPWRSAGTFAIASQVLTHSRDAGQGRETTGWKAFRRSGAVVGTFDLIPDDDTTVRGSFYAGCGAALFHKDLLSLFARKAGTYKPFSWEDVEWGTRAWRSGFPTLFCPQSHVWQNERGPYKEGFSSGEIERIQRRNGLLFQLRNDIDGTNEEFFGALLRLDRRSVLGIAKPARLFGIVRRRIETWREPFLDLPLEYTWHKYYLGQPGLLQEKPVVLMVSPFALLPPSHGGAVRIHRLIGELSSEFSFVLLSDEGERYVPAEIKSCSGLESLHLVFNRPDDASAGSVRIERIRNHSRSRLGACLKFLEHTERPDLVQVEYVELCKLAELRGRQPDWILTMHDVLQSGNQELTVEDQYELRFTHRFDAVITCSEEDARMVRHKNINIVPNGADIDMNEYAASPVVPHILFVGPLRIAQNFSGIQEFLERAYPRIRRRIPDVRLSILGGRNAIGIAEGAECFHQPGITVFEYVSDTRPFFHDCALTINPCRLVRGSCLKVIESIAAGRVCVSTRDGARGFLDDEFPGLVIEDTVNEFPERILDLLLDHDYRRRIEVPPNPDLARYSWQYAAKSQATVYRRCLLTRSGR